MQKQPSLTLPSSVCARLHSTASSDFIPQQGHQRTRRALFGKGRVGFWHQHPSAANKLLRTRASPTLPLSDTAQLLRALAHLHARDGRRGGGDAHHRLRARHVVPEQAEGDARPEVLHRLAHRVQRHGEADKPLQAREAGLIEQLERPLPREQLRRAQRRAAARLRVKVRVGLRVKIKVRVRVGVAVGGRVGVRARLSANSILSC